jgi:hypothetical protein
MDRHWVCMHCHCCRTVPGLSEGSDASRHVMKAGEGDDEHGWNSPDAGKATALIVIPVSTVLVEYS